MKTPKISQGSGQGDREHQPAAQCRRRVHLVRARGHRRTSSSRASRRCASSRRAAHARTTSAGREVLGTDRRSSIARRPTSGRSTRTASSSRGRSSKRRKASRTCVQIAQVKGLGRADSGRRDAPTACSRRPTPRASRSVTTRRGKPASRRFSPRARNSRCRAAIRPTRTTSRCA